MLSWQRRRWVASFLVISSWKLLVVVMSSARSDPLPALSTQHRDIFLSHRSSNKAFVRRLAADIEAQFCGGRRLLCWLDEAEIRPGQSIPGMIEQGLEMSRFFGIVMTPAYFSGGSGWTDAEWHAALHTDPDNRRARIVPLLAEDCPYIPFLLRHLLAIDLRGDHYQEGLQQLLRILRDEPLPRPVTVRGQLVTSSGIVDRATLVAERAMLSADPDVVSELAYCNLLPVEQLPRFVYAAPIAQNLYTIQRDGTLAVPSKAALREILRQAQQGAERPFMPAFRVYEDSIVSFHDLEAEDGPLSPLIQADAEVDVLPTDQLLQDEDSRRLVISLLNMALSRHAARSGLVIDQVKDGRFFFPPKDGQEQVIYWRPRRGGHRAKRTVAKPCFQDGHLVFWRHLGAYIKIIYLASQLYLFIRPTWVLTTNGSLIMAGPNIGRYVIKWTGAERNLQVLFHVRFWTTILRSKPGPGPLSIRAGDQRLEIAARHAMIQLPYGIADDQADLEQQLAEEAELLAEEEEAEVAQAIEAQIATPGETPDDDELEDVLDEEAGDVEE